MLAEGAKAIAKLLMDETALPKVLFHTKQAKTDDRFEYILKAAKRLGIEAKEKSASWMRRRKRRKGKHPNVILVWTPGTRIDPSQETIIITRHFLSQIRSPC